MEFPAIVFRAQARKHYAACSSLFLALIILALYPIQIVHGRNQHISQIDSSVAFKLCEKHLGSMFTKAEKMEICAYETSVPISGPTSRPLLSTYTVCALEVRKEFKMGLLDIVSLCEKATSLAHLR